MKTSVLTGGKRIRSVNKIKYITLFIIFFPLIGHAAISVGTTTDFTGSSYDSINDRDGWGYGQGRYFQTSSQYDDVEENGIEINGSKAIVLNSSSNWTGDWSGISSLVAVVSHIDSDYVNYDMRIAYSSNGSKSGPWAVTGNSSTKTLAIGEKSKTLLFDLADLELHQGDGTATVNSIVSNVAQVRIFYNSSFTHIGTNTLMGGEGEIVGGEWVLHSVTAVPEPSTFALLSGFVALMLVIRRRR